MDQGITLRRRTVRGGVPGIPGLGTGLDRPQPDPVRTTEGLHRVHQPTQGGQLGLRLLAVFGWIVGILTVVTLMILVGMAGGAPVEAMLAAMLIMGTQLVPVVAADR